jgi:hypothetical protein
MAQAPLSEAVLRQILSLVNATARANPGLPVVQRGSHRTVQALVIKSMAATGMPTGTAESRVRNVRDRRPDEWALAAAGQWLEADPASPAILEPEPAPPQPRSLGDDVDLGRARRTANEATSRLKDAYRRIADLEDRLRDYERAANSSARPAEWTLAPPMGARTNLHIPHLFASDFQVGEVIRADETDGGYGYDVATFKARYRRLIETTVELCFKHQAGWTYPGIIYARGGDAISGGIHDELAQTDELTPVEAVELCFEEEAAGILRLADAFGRVEVKGSDEGGNHGRDTHKPHSKRASGHSFERLISYMLRREFRTDERISFQTSASPDVYYSILGRRVLQTHGDKIGSRGGQGMIGPAATIARGAQKVIIEQQRLGRVVDEVQVGHFHTSLDLGKVLSNGSIPGYSEFAKLNRMEPELPCQWLSFYAERFGCVDRKRVYLEEPAP